jgi:hypothetical protein
MGLPSFKPLKEWAEVLGIPASTLRAEFSAGNLNGIRARPSCNAPILVSEVEVDRWVREVAGKRQLALSPAQAGKGNAAGGRHGS